ncbi:MATA-HMG [Gigaspora margarita]|uniref:MATA-HMG n=1 Tax=Gigaspora margarita TaxID=4874 RepID=A0A8H4ELD8_GIGMA|nr:MATA-HMG [Gigaspora margarita]
MPKHRRNKTNNITSSLESISIVNNFKPSFPPKITIEELISKSLSNVDSKYNRTPNPFIIYRKVFNREISKLNIDLSLKEISSKASESWHKESEHVKNAYRKLAEDAKIRFKSIAPLFVVSDNQYNINNINKEDVSGGLKILYFDPTHNDKDNKKDIDKEDINEQSVSLSNTDIDTILDVDSFDFEPTSIIEEQSMSFTRDYNTLMVAPNGISDLSSHSLIPENGNYYNLDQSLWDSQNYLYRHPLVQSLIARIQYLERERQLYCHFNENYCVNN